jgi:hypothetical protein
MKCECCSPIWLSGHQIKDSIPGSSQLRVPDSIQIAGESPGVTLYVLSMKIYFDLNTVFCVQLYIQDFNNFDCF